MPKRYNKRKVTRYSKRKKVSPSKNLGPLAVNVKTKFIYSDRFTLNPGIGGIVAAHAFSCNGLFDPNITGTGHQPRGFDQLIGVLYDHATVIAAKATIYLTNTDSANAQMVQLYINDGPSIAVGFDDGLERRYIKTRMLSAEGSGNNCATMSIALNPNRFLGVGNPLSSQELKNSATANPTEQCYFIVGAVPLNTVDVGAVECAIRIEYTTICQEPRQPSAS